MSRLVAVLAVAVLAQAPAALAWTWPVDGPVLRPFAFGTDPYAAGQHRGIDIGGAHGTAVRAATAGTVSFAGTVPSSGRTVTVRTADGLSVTYLELGAVAVGRGDEVAERGLHRRDRLGRPRALRRETDGRSSRVSRPTRVLARTDCRAVGRAGTRSGRGCRRAEGARRGEARSRSARDEQRAPSLEAGAAKTVSELKVEVGMEQHGSSEPEAASTRVRAAAASVAAGSGQQLLPGPVQAVGAAPASEPARVARRNRPEPKAAGSPAPTVRPDGAPTETVRSGSASDDTRLASTASRRASAPSIDPPRRRGVS